MICLWSPYLHKVAYIYNVDVCLVCLMIGDSYDLDCAHVRLSLVQSVDTLVCFLNVLIRTCSSRTVARETSRTCEEFMLIYDI